MQACGRASTHGCRNLVLRPHFHQMGTWCSGITSASHAEGPGFNPQCVQYFKGHQSFRKGKNLSRHSDNTKNGNAAPQLKERRKMPFCSRFVAIGFASACASRYARVRLSAKVSDFAFPVRSRNLQIKLLSSARGLSPNARGPRLGCFHLGVFRWPAACPLG